MMTTTTSTTVSPILVKDFSGRSYIRVKEVASSQEDLTLHDLGAVDKKGRAIGALVIVTMTDYVYAAEGEREGNISLIPLDLPAAGRFYSLRVQATRNGDPYGAYHHFTHFATEAERDVAVAKYLKSARARAVKAAATVSA